MPAIVIKQPNHDRVLQSQDRKARQNAIWAKVKTRGPEAAAHRANIRRRSLEFPNGKPYRKPSVYVKRFAYDEKLGKCVLVAGGELCQKQ